MSEEEYKTAKALAYIFGYVSHNYTEIVVLKPGIGACFTFNDFETAKNYMEALGNQKYEVERGLRTVFLNWR